MATAGARDLAASPTEGPGILGATFGVATAASLVAAGVAIAIGRLAYAGHPGVGHLIVYAALVCPFAVTWVVVGSLLAAAGRSGLRGILDAASSALVLGATLIVVGLRLSATAYVIGSVLAVAATAAASLVFLRRSGIVHPSWSEAPAHLRGRMAVIWTIGVTSVIGIVYRYIDTVMISLLSGIRQVGDYAIAYQLAGFVMSLPALILGASVQRYVRASQTARAEILQLLVDLLVTTALPLATILALFAGPIVRLIGGNASHDAQPAFVLLLVATVLLWCAAPFVSALVWSGNERLAAQVAIVSLVVNVVVNAALDHPFGARGGAVAMVASELVSAVGAGLLVRRRLNFTVRIRIPLLGAGSAVVIGGLWTAVRFG